MDCINQPQFIVRPALHADLEAIYNLKKSSVRPYVEKIWGWDEAYQYNDFAVDFQQIEQFAVIESDNAFIGFVQIFPHDSILELIEIHLLPQYREQGIGSKIIGSIVKRAKNRSMDVSIGCFKDNTRAKALYERLGFVLTEETDTHYLLKYRA